MRPTFSPIVSRKQAINLVYILDQSSLKYLTFTQKDILEQVESRVLQSIDLQLVAKFLYKNVITQYRVFKFLIYNNSLENFLQTANLLKTYRIKNIQISIYYSRANSIIEREYRSIVNTLTKIQVATSQSQLLYLYSILQTNRIIVYISIDITSYRVVYSQKQLLPIKLQFLIQYTILQIEIRTTIELLVVYTIQLNQQDKNLAKATLRLQQYYKQNKKYFNDYYQVQYKEPTIEDLVLLFNNFRNKNLDTIVKLVPCQRELYYIYLVREGIDLYYFKELDRSPLIKHFTRK